MDILVKTARKGGGCRFVAFFAVTVAFAAAVQNAYAATVRLTRSSDNGFVNAYGWDSGNPPESGNDYIVADGLYLRGDYSQGFAGDSLQFGIVGGTEGIFFKEHAGTHTFTKLILANGYYRTWMSNSGQAGHIAGSVQVTSPESAPFRLHSTHNGGLGWYITYWDAAITGAEGTGLAIGPYLLASYNSAHLSKGQTIFTGDNSGYLGSIYAYGTNAVFTFTTGNSLGGALSSFKADALTLADGTMFECSGEDVTLAASLNRGLTVDATGGRLHVGGGKALRLEWPVTGAGPFYKVGNGKLTLAAAMSLSAASGLTVSNGCIELVSGFSNSGDGGIAVLPECEVTVAAGDEVTVRNLALDGALRITYDESMATSGVLVLDSSCTPSWPIHVYTPNVREIKVPFLKVPTSLKTVTAADFAYPDDFAAADLPSAKFTVVTANGMQTVYAQTSKLVTIVDSKPSTGEANKIAYIHPWGSAKWMWSDNAVMHSGADYFAGPGKNVRSVGLSGESVMPGDSLTFSGSSSSRATFSLGNDAVTRFTGDIRTRNWVQINPTAANGSELHLDGLLYVGSTESSDHGLDFRAAKGGITLVIDSVVSGSGYFCFQPGANNRTNTYCFTSGDNTFNGTYFLYGGQTGAHTILKFASLASWGRNPATFRAESVLLQSASTMTVELYPAGSQVMAQPNRGFAFFGAGSRVRVDPDEEFTLQCPAKIRPSSHTYKVGGGTWAVGGTVNIDSTTSGSTRARALRPSTVPATRLKWPHTG